jgi:Fur family transcriptional regulator, ferric uptake regulator
MIHCIIMPVQIHAEKRKYQDYLDREGLRFSRGREAVFSQAIRTHGHFTAEEIAKACALLKPAVSRATVYRTLHEMLEASTIRGTAFGDKHQHYEHLYDEKKHHHAQCVRCHSFIEFPDLDEDRRYRPILEKKGFKIIGHEMHFYGICKKCRKGTR